MVLLLTMNCVLDNNKMFTDKSFTSLPVKFTNIFCRNSFCSTVHTQGLWRHFAQEHSQEGRERVRQVSWSTYVTHQCNPGLPSRHLCAQEQPGGTDVYTYRGVPRFCEPPRHHDQNNLMDYIYCIIIYNNRHAFMNELCYSHTNTYIHNVHLIACTPHLHPCLSI